MYIHVYTYIHISVPDHGSNFPNKINSMSQNNTSKEKLVYFHVIQFKHKTYKVARLWQFWTTTIYLSDFESGISGLVYSNTFVYKCSQIDGPNVLYW